MKINHFVFRVYLIVFFILENWGFIFVDKKLSGLLNKKERRNKDQTIFQKIILIFIYPLF